MENTSAACQSSLWKHTSDPKKAHKEAWETKAGALFHHTQYKIGAENGKWQIPFTNTFISGHPGSIWMMGEKLALRDQLSKMCLKYLGVK